MKKVVQDLTSGGIDWQREKWQSGLGSKFIHQGEKNAAKYADEVIVLSKGVQDYLHDTFFDQGDDFLNEMQAILRALEKAMSFSKKWKASKINPEIDNGYIKELWIDRRENSKSLAWSSVLLALNNIKEVGAVVDRPKTLGDIRGVTYIYGMFYRFGLIDMPDKVNGKVKRAGRQM